MGIDDRDRRIKRRGSSDGVAVKAGQLRHICEVWQPADSFTVKGDDEISYNHIPGDDEYCSIEPIQGREILFARQVRADVTHKIVMRYRPDISHRTVLLWNDGFVNRLFNLGPAVNTDLRNVLMNFYGVEIIAQSAPAGNGLVWGNNRIIWG